MNLLLTLVPIIAFLYASVGFGGATGYLAAMSFFDIPPRVMASTALLLNILVASISFESFYRAGHLRRDLLLLFLATSVPGAFLGGIFKIADQTYVILLYTVLTFIAIRLLFFSKKQDDSQPLRPVPPIGALCIGLLIGLLSGMVGIGGGIFLSPLIILARWATSKQASTISAAFIVVNSISALLARQVAGTFVINSFGLSLLPLGFLGALAGSWVGTQRLNVIGLRRALGVVMSITISNYFFGFWK